MGVTNLLQYLKPNEKCVNIKKYSGSVAAVDAMCWIHRGLISSAVANVRGDMCDKFMKFIISMIALMLSFSITPIMVFDGYDMPAKKAENEMRRERREKARKEALEMIGKNGNRINSDIMRKCMQAIHVTPEIIYRVITVCRKLNVPVIVSPYEADAQISYLCRSGVADFAVSEDSDLIVYGCPKVLYKLGRDGKAMELNVPFLNVNKNPFNSADFGNTTSSSNGDTKEQRDKLDAKVKEVLETKVKDGLFKGLNHKMFVIMCVLSGTDYDNGWHISGMGLKVAYKLVLEHENFEGILKSIYGNTKWADKVPELSYEDLLTHYTNVYNIFLHNIVFNPKNNQLVHINPVYTLNNLNTCNMGNSAGVANTTTGSNVDNLNLDCKLLRGYNYVYEMCLNIVNKSSNFMNVARGLVSVVDDMEIKYMLTETDLEIVDSLPEHISSYNKLTKGSKKDSDSNSNKVKRVKFDLYTVSTGNTTGSNSNGDKDNKTQFVLISTLCDSSVFDKLGSMNELKRVVKKELDTGSSMSNSTGVGNTATGSTKKTGTKVKLAELPKDDMRGEDNTTSSSNDNTGVFNVKVEGLTKREKNLLVKEVKKELGSNVNKDLNGEVVVKSKQTTSNKKSINSKLVDKSSKLSKEEKKRKVKELLNKTESYTVKRTKVKTS